MTRRKTVELIIGLTMLALFVFAGWYLTSPQFNQYVRNRIVTELETLTGGKVEIKDLRWNLAGLTFDVQDVTVRGKEAPNEVPFAHVDSLHVQAKILSLVQRRIGLVRLVAERPVIHIIVYPDGTTNRPEPAIQRPSTRSPIEQLFALAIDRLELRQGELLWNDERLPLDLNANDVALTMGYSAPKRRYDGQLNIGKLDGKFRDYRPVSSSAEVQFGILPTEVEVKALRWSTQQTRLEAGGRLVDFNNPKLEVAYKLSVDLGQAGSIARVRELRGGVMDVNGKGTYSLKEFASTGKLFLRDLRWQQPGMNLDDADVSAAFAVNQDELTLSSIDGRVFGGKVSGSAEIRQWLPTNQTAGKLEKRSQAGVVRLRVQDLDIGSVAAALATHSLPLDRVNAAGAASGEVSASWKGAIKRGSAEVNLSVVTPTQVAPDELPVTGQLEAVYSGAQEALNVKKLQVSTRGTELSVTGVLAPTSRLSVDFSTTNLNEFKPAMAAFGVSELPLELKGRATFRGNVSGKVKAPAVAGRLEVREFESLFAAKKAGAVGGSDSIRRIHWDLLSADVNIASNSAAVRNARLVRGQTQIAFDASGTLRNYKLTERDAVNAAVNIKDAPIADLQQIAGFSYPIQGTLNLRAQMQGTRLNPRGSGHFEITNGVAYEQPFRSLTADLNLVSNDVQVRNLNLAMNGSRLTGVAAYNLRSEAFRFDLVGTNWNLVELHRLQTEKLQVSGTAGFRAQGNGTLKAPVINGSLELRNLVVNGEPAGDLDATATTRGTEMVVSARSQFQDSELVGDGTVQLRGDFPANLEVRFTRLDFDPLLKAFLKGRITEHSSTGGIARIRGPLRRPKDLNATVELHQFRIEVEGIALENRGPMRFVLANQKLNVETLQVVGEGTDITAAGSVSPAQGGTADLRADGRINLKLLQSFNPDLLAYGLMTLSVRIGGDLKNPALTGTAQIADAGISFIDLPNGLSDINGTFAFDQNRLEVQKLTARTGGGLLNLTGFIAYSNGVYADLNARGRDIRIRYPAGISAVADLNLRFEGNTKRSNLSGDVRVTKFGVNPRFDFALYLARSTQPPTIPKPDSPLNNVQLDVHVVTTPELQVQTSLAKISGDADLRVRGTGARPVVLGRVNVLEGDIFFNGTKYHLERGDITFANPVRIEPVLNIEASARVRDVDITLGFHGSVDHLTTTYHSDPPLPTADIIALLAMGRTPEEVALNPQPQPTFTETASNAILSQALNAQLSSRVQRLFGVSRIKIDPQVGGPENNPNARVTVEQQVSDKVTLTYITNLTQAAQQVIQVEVHVNKRVSVVAVRDEFGVFGLEVKLRQRKW
ncbi:MAG: translocation/assembly module TamB domain-containing protein [Acidobacteriales bacterium]|nr:translocation/assembly module TamB domain-containing protein [Terriglobales bacterium]